MSAATDTRTRRTKPQVVPGEIPVENLARRPERQPSGLAKQMKLHRRRAGQGDRLAQLQLPPVGAEGVLVQLVDVLKQPRRAGEAPQAAGGDRGRRIGRCRRAGRGLPVVRLDNPGEWLLSLEAELHLRHSGHRGGLH